MDLIIFSCSGGVSIDSNSNQASIFNLMEEARPIGFPTALQVFVFAQFRRRANESATQTVNLIINLDREEVFRTPLTVGFEDKLRARIVANLAGLVLPQPGQLRFEISQRKKVFGEWIVEIHAPEHALLTVKSDGGSDHSIRNAKGKAVKKSRGHVRKKTR